MRFDRRAGQPVRPSFWIDRRPFGCGADRAKRRNRADRPFSATIARRPWPDRPTLCRRPCREAPNAWWWCNAGRPFRRRRKRPPGRPNRHRRSRPPRWRCCRPVRADCGRNGSAPPTPPIRQEINERGIFTTFSNFQLFSNLQLFNLTTKKIWNLKKSKIWKSCKFQKLENLKKFKIYLKFEKIENLKKLKIWKNL